MITFAPFDRNTQPAVMKIYHDSFVMSEEKTPEDILRLSKDKNADYYAIEDEQGSVIGLLFLEKYKYLVFIDYFAIDRRYRDEGYGSQALRKLAEIYPDPWKICLEVDISADTPVNRERIAFYRRNHYEMSPYTVSVFGTPMNIMTYNGKVSFQEYYKLREMVTLDIKSLPDNLYIMADTYSSHQCLTHFLSSV
jgi:GNAT superfamily N-acetyltransferase